MRTLYHGTSSVNIACIKTVGLEPGHAKGGDQWAGEHHMSVGRASLKRGPQVFVADLPVEANHFANLAVEEMGGDPVIVILHVPDDVFATFKVDELYARDKSEAPHAWRAHSISPSCIVDVTPAHPEPHLDADAAVMNALQNLLGNFGF